MGWLYQEVQGVLPYPAERKILAPVQYSDTGVVPMRDFQVYPAGPRLLAYLQYPDSSVERMTECLFRNPR